MSTTERPPARVLVVHDDIIGRRAICDVLTSDPRFAVAGESGSGRSATTLATSVRPDAIVLDLEMPWIDGAEALPLLRQAAPSARLVVCCISASGARAQGALALGADRVVDGVLERGRLCNVLAGLLWPPIR